MKLSTTAAFLLCSSLVIGQIQLDNQFSDWNGVDHVAAAAESPFVKTAITSNMDWLYLHIQFSNEVGLDENILPNDYFLLLDLDDDTSTGVNYASQGLGVDLLLNFASRQAIRYTGGSGIESFNEVGMRAAPTYSGEEFEVAFKRNMLGELGENIRVMWYDGAGQVGFPEDGMAHAMNESFAPWIPSSLERGEGTLTRVAFWNMNNRMNQTPAKEAMERILQAVSPDVIGLSEVANVSANYVRGLLNDWIPLEDDASWNVVKDDYDLMVASKGDVLSTHASVYRQFPVVVEAHEDWLVPMLFTSSHLKCCGGSSNEAQRQSEADEYMAFLRDAINGEGDGPVLSPNAPIVYGGDLNMVGLDNPIYTLVTGDISDETNTVLTLRLTGMAQASPSGPFCNPITPLITLGPVVLFLPNGFLESWTTSSRLMLPRATKEVLSCARTRCLLLGLRNWVCSPVMRSLHPITLLLSQISGWATCWVSSQTSMQMAFTTWMTTVWL